jgi:hypothetical protein
MQLLAPCWAVGLVVMAAAVATPKETATGAATWVTAGAATAAAAKRVALGTAKWVTAAAATAAKTMTRLRALLRAAAPCLRASLAAGAAMSKASFANLAVGATMADAELSFLLLLLGVLPSG